MKPPIVGGSEEHRTSISDRACRLAPTDGKVGTLYKDQDQTIQHSLKELELMIAHTNLHVRNYPRSKAFYIAALAPLGYRNNMESGKAAGFNDGKNTDLWISEQPAAVPSHLAFETDSRSKVEALSLIHI